MDCAASFTCTIANGTHLTLLNFQVYEMPMRTMNSRLQLKFKVLFQMMGNFGCRCSKGYLGFGLIPAMLAVAHFG